MEYFTDTNQEDESIHINIPSLKSKNLFFSILSDIKYKN